MWKCLHCGKTTHTRPWEKCPRCGLTLGRATVTTEKYQILQDVCRLNGYDLLIDTCAGSGKVQVNGDLINGSPIILEEIAKQKTPPARRVFIEADPKTFGLLRSFCKGSKAKFINGDCNQYLLNLIDGKTRTLVFIDPFGYGIPAIRRDIVLKISQTPETDLLITFTWRTAREIGFARDYLNSDSERNRRVAISYARSLHVWWGDFEWLKWGSMRRMDYVEKYASPLRKHNKVGVFTVPRYSKKHTYYLIFATKFNIPRYGILKWIREKGEK